MSELMLIEETVERASAQLQSVLSLIRLSVEEGELTAHRIHEQTGRIIDPVARAYYWEARKLLMLPYPRFPMATLALGLAATKEPACYSSTFIAVLELLESAAEDTVEDELAEAIDQDLLGTRLPQR